MASKVKVIAEEQMKPFASGVRKWRGRVSTAYIIQEQFNAKEAAQALN
jgi:hypothetical protein